jgi:hypothetical protein
MQPETNGHAKGKHLFVIPQNEAELLTSITELKAYS